ncbi:hypothetical protein Q31b_14510 [Novipirellula aureliae]|uniref:HlyD family secretion protein n=1 Tax=Novipirellula aureliae TaxID=2527966 RepID=A0A5C6E9U6_9BACT|nr:efflux RND transporter periplasmic adaptor subunit [Novipirellula aureliae]TWU43919.1 hypothetical protein Q31b_14510 [Novipirellula aureliae]
MQADVHDQPFVFSPSGPAPGGNAAPHPQRSTGENNPLVQETRREIADIVREVALAARSHASRHQFLGMLANRILVAMAAEGVVIWNVDTRECPSRRDAPTVPGCPSRRDEPTVPGCPSRRDEPTVPGCPSRRDETTVPGCPSRRDGSTDEWTFSVAHRIGKVTDQTIPSESANTHLQMIAEVIASGQPVVVPATPGATDSALPANPTHVAAAVVPIESNPISPHPSYVLEVFLEPDCGIATQRGYLRFVAQMADLAGEFLRNDQLRCLDHKARVNDQVDAIIASLHAQTNSRSIEMLAVDSVAKIFPLDRVALCYVEANDCKLVAVSHVGTIDRNGSAAKQIEAVANEYYCPATSCIMLPDEQEGGSSDLEVRFVASSEECDAVCLVGFVRSGSEPLDDLLSEPLCRIALHTGLAIRHRRMLEAIPMGRVIGALANQIHSRRRAKWFNPVVGILFMALVAVAALYPVPMRVTAPAVLRPADVQRVFAPRSAVIESIHVANGESVTSGQKLLSMSDPTLEQQMTALIGRRSILIQKQSAFMTALVDTASNRTDRSEQLQSERSLLAEELQTIDQQLADLEEVKQSLVIRATNDGVVDAWQIEQRLQGRPVNRGDALLEVIGNETRWFVDARVPLSRIDPVHHANQKGVLSAVATMNDAKDQPLPLTMQSIGPVIRNTKDGTDAKAVVLQIESSEKSMELCRSLQNRGSVNGTPIRVMFQCEDLPLVNVVFYDAIEMIRANLKMYF